MNAIFQSNYRLWMAIIHVRIVRNEASMSELRDAINSRRVSRERKLTDSEKAKLDNHYESQLRAYGKVEYSAKL